MVDFPTSHVWLPDDNIIVSRFYIWLLVYFFLLFPSLLVCGTMIPSALHGSVQNIPREAKTPLGALWFKLTVDLVYTVSRFRAGFNKCWYHKMPKILLQSIYHTPNKVNHFSILGRNHVGCKQCSDKSHQPKQVLMIRWWGRSCTVAHLDLSVRRLVLAGTWFPTCSIGAQCL